MNTPAGRDTFQVIKEMGELQEWSYGFDIIESDTGDRDGLLPSGNARRPRQAVRVRQLGASQPQR
jgi:hypothetical protein